MLIPMQKHILTESQRETDFILHNVAHPHIKSSTGRGEMQSGAYVTALDVCDCDDKAMSG